MKIDSTNANKVRKGQDIEKGGVAGKVKSIDKNQTGNIILYEFTLDNKKKIKQLFYK